MREREGVFAHVTREMGITSSLGLSILLGCVVAADHDAPAADRYSG